MKWNHNLSTCGDWVTAMNVHKEHWSQSLSIKNIPQVSCDKECDHYIHSDSPLLSVYAQYPWAHCILLWDLRSSQFSPLYNLKWIIDKHSNSNWYPMCCIYFSTVSVSNCYYLLSNFSKEMVQSIYAIACRIRCCQEMKMWYYINLDNLTKHKTPLYFTASVGDQNKWNQTWQWYHRYDTKLIV